jgi:hypothetical protein
MQSSSVVIHCKPEYNPGLDICSLPGVRVELNTINDEIDVYVDDIPYEVLRGDYQDPDEQLCEHYGIDYDQVNMIESA